MRRGGGAPMRVNVPLPGLLFIVSAPSGAGKTSLVNALLERDADVELSVSFTTRAPRPGELDGRDYHFVERERFVEMAGQGEFLESAEVHSNLYGTSGTWVRQRLQAGRNLLLEIDWQGAVQVRRLIPEAIGIFILPPSLEALRERLKGRGQDNEAVIERRIAAARGEMQHVEEFDYVIINQRFEVAAEDLVSIVRAHRLRVCAQTFRHQDLITRLK